MIRAMAQEQPPEGQLIEQLRGLLRVEDLALQAGISAQRWRAVERGTKDGKPTKARAGNLARMAYVVRATPGQLRQAGRPDAAALLERMDGHHADETVTPERIQTALHLGESLLRSALALRDSGTLDAVELGHLVRAVDDFRNADRLLRPHLDKDEAVIDDYFSEILRLSNAMGGDVRASADDPPSDAIPFPGRTMTEQRRRTRRESESEVMRRKTPL